MNEAYIETNVRRTNRNLLISNLILLTVMLLMALGGSRFLFNFALGPFPMDNEALLSLKNPHTLQKYWVTVQADQVADTGVQAIHTSHSKGHTYRTVIGSYWLANFGPRVLLVKAPVGFTGPAGSTAITLTGALQPVADDEESAKIYDLQALVPNQAQVLPFMLVVSDFHADGWLGVIIGIGLLCLALVNLGKAARRNSDPEVHPLYQALRAYGPSASIVPAVDAEVAGPQAIRFDRYSHAVITPHWLLAPSTFGVQVVHLDDLVWVYEKVIRGKSTSYVAVFWTNQGTHTEIHDRQTNVLSILNHVQEHAPWALVGLTPENQRAWKSNRQAVIERATERRRNGLRGI